VLESSGSSEEAKLLWSPDLYFRYSGPSLLLLCRNQYPSTGIAKVFSVMGKYKKLVNLWRVPYESTQRNKVIEIIKLQIGETV
jgi:hypothetical protein